MRTSATGGPSFSITPTTAPAGPAQNSFRAIDVVSRDAFQGVADGKINLTGAEANTWSNRMEEAFPGLTITENSPPDVLKMVIRQDFIVSHGRDYADAGEQRKNEGYWLPRLNGTIYNDSGTVSHSAIPEPGKITSMQYWHQRMLGEGAGGVDTAKAGPYKGMDFGPLIPAGGGFDTLARVNQAFDSSRKKRTEDDAAQKPAEMSRWPNLSEILDLLSHFDSSNPDSMKKLLAALEKDAPGKFRASADGKSIVEVATGASFSPQQLAVGAAVWSDKAA